MFHPKAHSSSVSPLNSKPKTFECEQEVKKTNDDSSEEVGWILNMDHIVIENKLESKDE